MRSRRIWIRRRKRWIRRRKRWMRRRKRWRSCIRILLRSGIEKVWKKIK